MKQLNTTDFFTPFVAALSTAIMFLAQSCRSSSDEPKIPASERTILVYMADNNDLSDYAQADMLEMEQGMKQSKSGRLLVYQQTRTSNPLLMEINRDGSRTVLQKYDPGLPAVSSERMSAVIADAKKFATSVSYGLVLWSHGSGWADDKGTITDDSASPLSFGADGPTWSKYKKMSIRSLSNALDGNHFDFIYFDCCHMATVEVAYELRHITDFIVACPTELGVDGMPYNQTLTHLFAPEADLEKTINATFSFYEGFSNGCCISLIRTSALDSLASVSRDVLNQTEPPIQYTPVPYFRTSVMSAGIYDMYHYFFARTTRSPDLAKRWTEAFLAAVPMTLTTPYVYWLDAQNFNGLGCNIISESNPAETGNYNLTAWYRDVF